MNSEKIVSALRILSTDAINKAKSGHPGICLGAAPIVNALFYNVMNITPENQTGGIEIDLFYLLVMVHHFYIVHFI